jgi:hypothetical protein
MLPVYEDLLHYNLEILVYSGDVDAIVPVRTYLSCRCRCACCSALRHASLFAGGLLWKLLRVA